MAAVAQQPVGVGVDAGELPFQTYKSGIITTEACLKAENHAITAVGYGVSNTGIRYFIVKNSWSSAWGESGYVRIKADSNIGGNARGVCGILGSPGYAMVAK